VIDGAVDGANCVDVADIDGDGDLDLFAGSRYANDIVWYENETGNGERFVLHIINGSFGTVRSVRTCDMDGDGYPDVLATSSSGDDVYWWENNGTGSTWTQRTVNGVFNGARSACAVDMDGDGDQDVVGAAYSGDDITWWANANGLGTSWVAHVIDGSFDGAISVGAADLDGDGDKDVVAAGYNASDIAWWANSNGIGTTWVEHEIDYSFPYASGVSVADVEGDGDIDVVGTSGDASLLTWWANSGEPLPTWTEHIVDTTVPGASSAVVCDLDSDGDMDIIGASYGNDAVYWWRNADGGGISWTRHNVVTGLDGALSTVPGDLDSDGAMDIAWTGEIADDVGWSNMNGFPDDGYLESSILDTGCDPLWGVILWTSQTPSGTNLCYQVRASDNASSMGAWSDTLFVPGSLGDLLADGTRFFQYRIILKSSNSAVTPTLLDMTVTWNPLGAGGGTASEPAVLMPVSPNPSGSSVSIRFELAAPGAVEIAVFDICGRLEASIPATTFDEGRSELLFDGLSAGVHFCRMTAGDYQAVERFAVVE